MDFTFLFIAVVRYGSQFQNTLIDYILVFQHLHIAIYSSYFPKV